MACQTIFNYDIACSTTDTASLSIQHKVLRANSAANISAYIAIWELYGA